MRWGIRTRRNTNIDRDQELQKYLNPVQEMKNPGKGRFHLLSLASNVFVKFMFKTFYTYHVKIFILLFDEDCTCFLYPIRDCDISKRGQDSL